MSYKFLALIIFATCPLGLALSVGCQDASSTTESTPTTYDLTSIAYVTDTAVAYDKNINRKNRLTATAYSRTATVKTRVARNDAVTVIAKTRAIRDTTAVARSNTNRSSRPRATRPPTPMPTPTPGASTDDELCELWLDYGAEIVPLAESLVEILAEEISLISKTRGNASLMWTDDWQSEMRASFTESDFSARMILRTKAPDQFERRTRPIDTVMRSLLERNAAIRKAFDNPESAKDWEGIGSTITTKLVELMEDLYNAHLEEVALPFKVCDTFGDIFPTDPSR